MKWPCGLDTAEGRVLMFEIPAAPLRSPFALANREPDYLIAWEHFARMRVERKRILTKCILDYTISHGRNF